MSLPQYPRVHFRAGDLLPDLLARAAPDEDGTPSERTVAIAADRDLHRYYYLLRLALPSFSEAEASLIVEALNGLLTEAHTARLVRANIQDAIEEGLAAKHGVDGDALLARLRALSEFEQMAIADAAERFWAGPYRKEDMGEALRAVGLVR
jgi:hypothetical protein